MDTLKPVVQEVFARSFSDLHVAKELLCAALHAQTQRYLTLTEQPQCLASVQKVNTTEDLEAVDLYYFTKVRNMLNVVEVIEPHKIVTYVTFYGQLLIQQTVYISESTPDDSTIPT